MAYQTPSGWTFDTFFSSLESYEFLYNVFFFYFDKQHIIRTGFFLTILTIRFNWDNLMWLLI